jgi:hypothetical protein
MLASEKANALAAISPMAADRAQKILKVSARSNAEVHKKAYPNGKSWK